MSEAKKTGLELLREPFIDAHISKLPKGTKAQNECQADQKINCKVCGGWHHPKIIHLDYVGHAALTHRLLDCDPAWFWEPLAMSQDGLPVMDSYGGMWIKLTVCGVMRLGYGHAGTKTGGDAIKEVIGDCLMRGTQITTARGDVAIESVVIGDMVPTRDGWRPVTDHWMSDPHAPMLAVTLSNGSRVIGTPHHKVPTEDGVKRLHALRNTDIMFAWQDTANALAQKTLNGMAESIGATRLTTPCTVNGISWRLPRRALTFIETSIANLAKRFLADGTSITMMKIGTTTTQRIWLRFLHAATLNVTGPLVGNSQSAAMSAEARTLQPCFAVAGAAHRAKNDGAARMASLMPGLSNRPNSESCNAQSAQHHSHRASPGPGFVPVRVAEVTDAGCGEVWNISVGETHEYVASGVLVMNSLRNAAMRFGAALDLWHKGDLHADEPDTPPALAGMPADTIADWQIYISDAADIDQLTARTSEAHAAAQSLKDRDAYACFTASKKKRAGQIGGGGQ